MNDTDHERMTDRLRILKQQSIQVELDLVQECLSDDLLEELVETLPELKEQAILVGPVTTKAELKELTDLIKEFRQRLPSALREDLRDELAEIREDLNWLLSKEGRAVVDLESWLKIARDELKDLHTVFIGRSWQDPGALIVNGVVSDEDERIRVVHRIEALDPPVTPKNCIELSSDVR